MMLMAGSMGHDVNSAETSYEVIFICLESAPFHSFYKVTCVLDMVGELPTKGLRILANSLATS